MMLAFFRACAYLLGTSVPKVIICLVLNQIKKRPLSHLKAVASNIAFGVIRDQ